MKVGKFGFTVDLERQRGECRLTSPPSFGDHDISSGRAEKVCLEKVRKCPRDGTPQKGALKYAASEQKTKTSHLPECQVIRNKQKMKCRG